MPVGLLRPGRSAFDCHPWSMVVVTVVRVSDGNTASVMNEWERPDPRALGYSVPPRSTVQGRSLESRDSGDWFFVGIIGRGCVCGHDFLR